MTSKQIQNKVAAMRNSLFKEGYLDDQFLQLEELEDASNPNFVEDVVSLFFRDKVRHIISIEKAIEYKPLDFQKLDSFMHRFKGSISSIGALKVKDACVLFSQCARDEDAEGVSRAFELMKKELANLKKKLEDYFQLAREVGSSVSADRPE